MTRSSSRTTAERFATTAGVVTAVAGCALLRAPDRTGPLLGLAAKRDAQLVGILDLALAPGLIVGRPRWPWLTARAVSNVATAAFVLARAGDEASLRHARMFSAGMVLATLADVRTLRVLRRTAQG